MRRELVTSALAVVAVTVLLGLGYPLVVTGISQLAFHGRANGSLIESGGRVVGSRLLAQSFEGRPVYFQPRPSTATDYDPSATAFTNLGPDSREARRTFARNLAAYLERERPFDRSLTAADVPVDAVTSSASGVDPDISPANAAVQAHRIATVRHMPLAQVDRLISDNTDGRSIGVLGEPGVDVLQLNLTLDRVTAR
jgi:K+-transporting ATPase ATPase C chain